MQVSRSDRAKLVCTYRRHRPIFYIRPVKEELLNVDPKVVVFHDVITDSEIAKIKEVSTPRVHTTDISSSHWKDTCLRCRWQRRIVTRVVFMCLRSLLTYLLTYALIHYKLHPTDHLPYFEYFVVIEYPFRVLHIVSPYWSLKNIKNVKSEKLKKRLWTLIKAFKPLLCLICMSNTSKLFQLPPSL